MQITSEFSCAYCGEANVLFVDMTAGEYQQYIEDCQVCCQPNTLYISVDEEAMAASVTADPIDG